MCLLLLLTVILCFTVTRMGRDAGLYARCFHAFADTGSFGVGPEMYDGIARAIADHLSGNEADLSLFNAREIIHLTDIRGLFRLFDRGLMLIVPALVLAFFLMRGPDKSGLLAGAGLAALILGALALWIALDFEGAFITMHRVLFTNDLWLLDPRTDLLICLMPEEMFLYLAGRLALYVMPCWLLAAFVLLAPAAFRGRRG